MIARAPRFPERLRRPAKQPQRRRRMPIAAAIPGLLLLLPLWRVQGVELSGSEALPPTAAQSLVSLAGSSALGLDLEWVRSQALMWPAVGHVEVRFELPGTLHVSTSRAPACGSLRMGRGWHGVSRDGSLVGRLPGPVSPRVEGFPPQAGTLRQALAVADRLHQATGAQVESVRQIMPEDLEVLLRFAARANQQVVVHVRPHATRGERLWCESCTSGSPASHWADLRFDTRLVVGEGR